MTYRKWNGNGGGGRYRLGEGGMKSGESLLMQIDGATGEVTRTEMLRKGEKFVVKTEANALSEYRFNYQKEYVKSFPVGKAFAVFRNHPNLYFYAVTMAQWLKDGTGILWRVNEPYAWRHLGQDMNFDHTTLYRIRRKLLDNGIVAQIRYFGTKCLCLNPFLFGKGDKCLKAVAQYFNSREIFKRWNNEREFDRKG